MANGVSMRAQVVTADDKILGGSIEAFSFNTMTHTSIFINEILDKARLNASRLGPYLNTIHRSHTNHRRLQHDLPQ